MFPGALSAKFCNLYNLLVVDVSLNGFFGKIPDVFNVVIDFILWDELVLLQ